LKIEYAYVAVLDFSDKHVVITLPDLEEALSQADKIDQVIKRSNDLLKLTIESRLEGNQEIPEPTALNEIVLKEGQRTLIATCSLKEKVKYVKKTLTIPHTLNVAAEEAGINFSKVLQDALREKLAEQEA
jgi:predicted RNase H-like HicB family nuclease